MNILRVIYNHEAEEQHRFIMIAANETKMICFYDTGKLITSVLMDDERKIRDIVVIHRKRFILFYNDKPYIDIFNLDNHDNQSIRKHFDKKIKNIFYNLAWFWVWNSRNYYNFHFAIFLENFELHLFKTRYTDSGECYLQTIHTHSFSSDIVGGFRLIFANVMTFFAMESNGRCLSLRMKVDDKILHKKILKAKDFIENRQLRMLTFFGGGCGISDGFQTHLYNPDIEKWISIPQEYIQFVAGVQGVFNCTIIYAYTNKYLDIYLVSTKSGDHQYKIVKIIDKFFFVEEPYRIIFHGR